MTTDQSAMKDSTRHDKGGATPPKKSGGAPDSQPHSRSTSKTPRVGGLVSKAVRRIDPIGWLPATAAVAKEAAKHPADVTQAGARFVRTVAKVPRASIRRFVNSNDEPPVPPGPRDKRFADPAWDSNPFFFGIRQAYLATCNLVDEVVDAGSVDYKTDERAKQFVKLVQNIASPTNFAITNPEVLTKALQTGGKSLFSGARYAAEDVRERGGRPKKVDRNDFEMGKTLAATPGKVVFRNDLVELIQFEPQTPTVHQTPILFSPPWINKYYVMDLAPRRSFAEWAVRHDRTVFVLSYVNPDESMRDVSFDDYLRRGSINAIDVVKEITKSPKVDVVGLCLGGVSATIASGYLRAIGDESLGTLTLLNTMLDYAAPGEMGVMISAETMAQLQDRMQQQGYLSGDDMSFTFDLMRANDLIFNYVVSRWLKGEPPPAFDILAWNEDSTHMTEAMYTEYMADLYADNKLCKGTFTLGDDTIDLSAVKNDVYVVGAINDHIVPWQASYAAVHLFGGNVRYVLSSGGHIAGIVNPPSPKAWFEVLEDSGAQYPEDPAQWRAAVTRRADTWWRDWIEWTNATAGDLVKPPKMGSAKHKPICDAPGTYVMT